MNPLSPLNPLGPLRPPPQAARAEVPPPAPQDAFTQTSVRPDVHRARTPEERPDLLHPGTPREYREQLEPLLQRLPAGLVRGVAEAGYTLHVIGPHPLTLTPEPAAGPPEERTWSTARALSDIADETGAALAELLHANPHLPLMPDCPDATPVAAGEPLQVPAQRLFHGTPVNAAAWEFLTQPRRSFMAGLVTHGKLPGFLHEENRILLWDLVFRDPLRDWHSLHEMGHTTDFTFAFRQPEAWREWRRRLEAAHARDARPFTRYAGESPTEYFAEGFAAWATPEAGDPRTATGDLAAQRLRMCQDALRERAPELHALIEEAVSRSSPAG